LKTYAKELELRKNSAAEAKNVLPMQEPYATRSEVEHLRRSSLDSLGEETEKLKMSKDKW
jgi:hypothetical protein